MPKVRAITAFVRINHNDYQRQIAEALTVLRKARNEFQSAGYEVESLRVTTQPLGELVTGMHEEEALAFLKEFDQLSAKEDFIPNVGRHTSTSAALCNCLGFGSKNSAIVLGAV